MPCPILIYCKKENIMTLKSKYMAEIEKTYQAIDSNFDTAFKECKADKERKALTSARDAARDAFWSAVASNLANQSDEVEQQYCNLKNANNELDDSLRELKDIATLINVMEEAVRLAAKLAVAAA